MDNIIIPQNEDIEESKEEEVCPVCGSPDLMRAGHCMTCMTCGYSLCSL
jgi:hypothetical protein